MVTEQTEVIQFFLQLHQQVVVKVVMALLDHNQLLWVALVDQVVVVDQVLVQQIQEEQETHLQFHPLKEQTVVIMYTQLHLTHKAVAVVVLLQRVVVDQVL
jgi:hypothetical protein